MRVLFLEKHPVWIYGLPGGFSDEGHEVRISGSVTEENLHKLCDFSPDLVITLGWTPEHTAYRLKLVRKYIDEIHKPLIYWATEDPTYTHLFSLPLIQAVKPDFIFTISVERIKYYESLGWKAAHLPFAYHPGTNFVTPVDQAFQTDVAVVANGYPDYISTHPDCVRNLSIKALVRPLLEDGTRIDFWGKHWDRLRDMEKLDIPDEWIHGYLPYTEANKVYNGAKINLGLQNSQLAQRTYEILGSGGFLLTYDTSKVRQVFEPGRDLLVSSGPDQTLEIAQRYLDNPEARQCIQVQGHATVAGHHTYRHRAQTIISALQAHGIL